MWDISGPLAAFLKLIGEERQIHLDEQPPEEQPESGPADWLSPQSIQKAAK